MDTFPNSWLVLPLRAVGLASTSNLDPAKHSEEIFELYSVPAYSNGCADVVAGSEIKSIKQQVLPNDVLLCKIVPHLNRVWCVPQNGSHRQIASGEWIVVRSNLADPYYLRYALSEPGFRSKFMETVSGVGGSLMRARPKAVAEIPIAIPPLDEQRRIVDKLDSLFDRSRRAREELARVPRLVERYKQAVLAAAFGGELTADWRASQEPSSNWTKTTLGSLLVDLRYGTAKKCYYEQPGAPVLRIPNIGDGVVDIADLKYAPLDDKEKKKLSLRQGDILVIRSNGSLDLVGKAAMAGSSAEGFAFAGYLIRMRLETKDVLPQFVLYFLQSPSARQEIERLAKSTSGVNNINSEELRGIPLELPSLPEQFVIVSRVKQLLRSVERVRLQYEDAHRLLDRLDQASLAKAFRGELVPQDPNDEPASAMLERLQADASDVTRPKRGRKPKKPAEAA